MFRMQRALSRNQVGARKNATEGSFLTSSSPRRLGTLIKVPISWGCGRPGCPSVPAEEISLSEESLERLLSRPRGIIADAELLVKERAEELTPAEDDDEEQRSKTSGSLDKSTNSATELSSIVKSMTNFSKPDWVLAKVDSKP